MGGANEPDGLVHLGARMYGPTTGRFISPDRILNIADPQQANGYAYADNNPTTSSDPNGLDDGNTTAHITAIVLRMQVLQAQYPGAVWGATKNEHGPDLICWGCEPGKVWAWEFKSENNRSGPGALADEIAAHVAQAKQSPLSADMEVVPGPSLYPDRIRRRPEGANSNGLGTHLDPGTLDLWMTEAYQNVFRHLFDGTVEQYDPWDAAYRTAGPQYPGSTMCSAFRTFQGWTALSDMAHDQGVLHTVPIPDAMAYLMLRPLLSDVPEDDMCGVTVNQVFPANDKWHPLLMQALSGIPDVQAGDSVWWHCDMIHSVAPVENQQGWGNVMYIPAAPWCPRNEEYAASVREAFVTGFSPSDFPEEHYERTWTNRFQLEDLNETGRRGLGLD